MCQLCLWWWCLSACLRGGDLRVVQWTCDLCGLCGLCGACGCLVFGHFLCPFNCRCQGRERPSASGLLCEDPSVTGGARASGACTSCSIRFPTVARLGAPGNAMDGLLIVFTIYLQFAWPDRCTLDYLIGLFSRAVSGRLAARSAMRVLCTLSPGRPPRARVAVGRTNVAHACACKHGRTPHRCHRAATLRISWASPARRFT